MKNCIQSFIVLIFLTLNMGLSAQLPPTEISDTFQSILNNALPVSTFANSGAVIEVHVPGMWTWNSASGSAIAGITNGQPQTLATATAKFRVGSITKMMVATCILKLEEVQLLSIEDPISMYLRSTLVTDTIASSGVVKIRDLLNHTSGIANSGSNTVCQTDVLSDPLGTHTLEEAIYCGASQGELYAPETGWTYSNTNYSILAMIIENVTGISYKDYLTQTIITPLGLTNTEIPGSNQITGAHMGCYWNIGSWIDLTIINPTTYTGWADVVSTTSDLVTFMQALRSEGIINTASLTKMGTVYTAANQYGLGYDLYTYYGITYNGHYGEVANTCALFFVNTTSTLAPNGYYIAYNFNVQGVDDIYDLALPILNYLRNSTNSVNEFEPKISNTVVYPNPASSQLNILGIETSGNQKVQLMDELGKIVFITSSDALADFSIDCSTYKRGIYTLSIQGDSKIEFHQIILH